MKTLRVVINYPVPKGAALWNPSRAVERVLDLAPVAPLCGRGPHTMARPKKGETDRLTRTVSVALTEADYLAWLDKVQASGLTRSAFFRECVLTNRTEVVARPRASADKTRLLYLASKASNNINQLAHRANADHQTGIATESTYQSILYELQALNTFLSVSVSHVD